MSSSENWSVDHRSHTREQRRAVAKMTIEERMRWLEAVLDEARRSGALERECRRRDREALRLWNEET